MTQTSNLWQPELPKTTNSSSESQEHPARYPGTAAQTGALHLPWHELRKKRSLAANRNSASLKI